MLPEFFPVPNVKGSPKATWPKKDNGIIIKKRPKNSLQLMKACFILGHSFGRLSYFFAVAGEGDQCAKSLFRKLLISRRWSWSFCWDLLFLKIKARSRPPPRARPRLSAPIFTWGCSIGAHIYAYKCTCICIFTPRSQSASASKATTTSLRVQALCKAVGWLTALEPGRVVFAWMTRPTPWEESEAAKEFVEAALIPAWPGLAWPCLVPVQRLLGRSWMHFETRTTNKVSRIIDRRRRQSDLSIGHLFTWSVDLWDNHDSMTEPCCCAPWNDMQPCCQSSMWP